MASSAALGEIAPPDIPTNVILRPGDVACFTVDAAHGLQAVPQAPASAPHIAARLVAEPAMTMLFVKNGTSSDVAYRALIRVPGDAKWRETSIVPVMAGLLGAESWPHPIDAIALFELRPAAGR